MDIDLWARGLEIDFFKFVPEFGHFRESKEGEGCGE
jgi:hypothetical protein